VSAALIDALCGARAYDLEQPRYAGAPVFPVHEPGLLLKLHRRHEPGLGEARTGASALLVMAEHAGTHIDALCQRAEDMQMYGGVAVDSSVQTPEGFTELGMETVAPLIARGVLLDVSGAGHEVSAGDLEQAAGTSRSARATSSSSASGQAPCGPTVPPTRRPAASAPTARAGWPSAHRSRSAPTTSPGTSPACAIQSWARCRATRC
jgi:hypothetical protein